MVPLNASDATRTVAKSSCESIEVAGAAETARKES
jgi:hypothetical protein